MQRSYDGRMEQELEPVRLAGDDDENGESDKNKRDLSAAIALDILKKERTVIISEEVTPRLTQKVISSLLWLDSQSDDPIKLYINTPGGSADDGFAIHDTIRFIKAPVYCITLGLNASAGILILLAAPRDRRLATPNSRLMMHQPSGAGRGTSSDITITAEEIIKLRQRANELIARETGQPMERVEKDTDRDFWMSPEAAREYGLLGRVITSLREVF